MKLKIIIPTCDKYLHIMEPLCYTIKKYWKNHGDVIILGYKEPTFDLPENITFHSLGEDGGPNHWSDCLITFFNDFKDEYFINLEDDILLIRDVNNDRIGEIFSHMKNDEMINKVFLASALTSSNTSDDYNNLDLLKIKQTSEYRTSVSPAILKTSYVRKYLKPNQSAWDYELQNSKNDNLTILTVKEDLKAPIILSHLYRKDIGLVSEWYKSFKTGLHMFDDDKIIISKMLNIN